MKTLCMDTAHRYLVLGLYENDEVVASVALPSWKKQSETIFPRLMELMEQAGWQSEDIEEVVITQGPGSYTGVRIAMSIAKVFCTTRDVPLYTISTLLLYAGVHDHALVMLDARSSRAYVGLIDHGKFECEATILTLDEIKNKWMQTADVILGDSDLIDIEPKEVDFIHNFIETRPYWKRVENIHTLVPCYLKEQDAYKVK